MITLAGGVAGETPAGLDDLEARVEYDAAMDILARLTAVAARRIQAEQLKPEPDHGEIYRWDAVAQISSQRMKDLKPADRVTVALILQGGRMLARFPARG
jgi:hypothetical protein